MVARSRPRVLAAALLTPLLCCPGVTAWGKKKAAQADPDPHDPNVLGREIRGMTEKTVPVRTHSIYAPYVDSDLQNRWFDFGGSTLINTNKHIRLTQDRRSQSGWLWSRQPLLQSAFEIEVEFKIDGKSSNLFGDGLAIWLAKTPEQLGPVFGSRDYWEGLTILIDTYPNSRHSYTFPRILGITNDGSKSYDIAKDGQTQEAGACSLAVRRTEVSTKLKVVYLRGKFLEVQVHHEKWDTWTHCFTLFNYTLPSQFYLGFSAHTGDVSDNHDIISVSTSNVVYHGPSQSSSQRRAPGRRRKGGGGGGGTVGFFGFLSWLLKWAAILATCALVAIAVRQYTKRKKRGSSKRF